MIFSFEYMNGHVIAMPELVKWWEGVAYNLKKGAAFWGELKKILLILEPCMYLLGEHDVILGTPMKEFL